MKYAKLAYFYGWTHDEIDGLDAEITNQYWFAITAIEAQEMLKQMKIAQVPYMKKDDYRKLHRDLHRQAYPKVSEGPAVGPHELAAALRAGVLRGQ